MKEAMSQILHNEDCRRGLPGLPAASVDCCVTSPPYWRMRDYGHPDQIGLEECLDCFGWTRGENCGECFVCRLRGVFGQVRRALTPTGSLWLNLGDSYAANPRGAVGRKSTLGNGGRNQRLIREVQPTKYPVGSKNLLGVPWRVALALQTDGWILRQDVIWRKTCPMPDPARDRPSRGHEYFFFFSKSRTAFFNPSGRHSKSVWDVTPDHSARHVAAMPMDLARSAILAACPPDGVVLDPFAGSGTTGEAALRLGCAFIGYEIAAAAFAVMRDRLRAAAATQRRMPGLFDSLTEAGNAYDDE
jgi:DNA modification methylase